MPSKTPKAELQEDKVIIWDKGDARKIFDKGWFGEMFNDR